MMKCQHNYLLIVCFLNIGYHTENWQLTTCSFFMLQYPVECPSANIFPSSGIVKGFWLLVLMKALLFSIYLNLYPVV